ncbi:hypothetical protein ACHAW6_009689 [Cyclotella cf. meneghiniana]
MTDDRTAGAKTDGATGESSSANDKSQQINSITCLHERFITLPLLRKRSEHNEGLVSTLEEVALHQEELQSIGPVLGRTCGKTLKILLLQNNVIKRMKPSELKHFKCLEYLNLALNNIAKIEGVRGMEFLRKLDLTLNFIPVENLEESIDELTECRSLEELFLIGNPCMGISDANGESQTDDCPPQSAGNIVGWYGCRSYVIARLSNLRFLDGKEVKRSERIAALQKFPALSEELRNLSKIRLEKQQTANPCNNLSEDENYEIDENAPTHHNPETRNKISNEMYAQKQSKERQETSHLVPQKGEKELEVEHMATVRKIREREEQNIAGRDEHKANDEIKQCNQGKWQFWFEESGTAKRGRNGDDLIMRIAVPKHLSTSLIDVDIHPTYVSVIIKSKLLRVVLPVEVISDQSAAKRIAASGHLELTMPKTNPDEVAIGMPYVRSNKPCNRSDATSERSGAETNLSNVVMSGKRRERLGYTIMQEAVTVEALQGIIPYRSIQSNATDLDEEPPSLC